MWRVWYTPCPSDKGNEQAYDFIVLMLNTLRYQGAITYLMGNKIDLVKDEAFAPRNKMFYFRQEGGIPKKGVFGWQAATGYRNARLDFIIRMLMNRGYDEDQAEIEGREILITLWLYLSSTKSDLRFHLTRENDQKLGILYRINHTLWQIKPSIFQSTQEPN